MAQVHHAFTSHSPVGHTETAAKSGAVRHETEGSRTLAGMLLAAVMAALLVAADQVIDTWADGHLLAGWVALWTVAFAALALLAPPLRQVSTVMASMFSTWARAGKLRRQEESMWEYARRDPRVMAELQSAWTRESDDSLPFNAVSTAR